MENSNAFKHRIGGAVVQQLATATRRAWRRFDEASFRTRALDGLEALELKARVKWVTQVWAEHLPPDYAEALPLVLATMGPPLKTGAQVSEGLFFHWIHAQFVESYGLSHVLPSLHAMRELTQRSTAEFCVRPFLVQHPDETLAFLTNARSHASPHVRRWVSEGTRPRLPWGLRLAAFVKDPGPVLALIAPLRFDDEEYVRTSVANNLNDIAKDHPELVVETVKAWLGETSNPHAPWIAKRALRTLIKQGHAGALEALGFSAGTRTKLVAFTLDRASLSVGDDLQMEVTLRAGPAEVVNLDYAIGFQLAGGKRGEKVFKLKVLNLDKGQTVVLRKKHSFRPITTRKYYGGEHSVALIANGQTLGRATFTLQVPSSRRGLPGVGR